MTKFTPLACLLLPSVPTLAVESIEEVVVTAQHRTEALQDIPLAVSVFDSDELTKLGWDRPTEVAAQVPNMHASMPYGDVQPLFAIRGISMIDYTPSQSSPIGVYADEAYLGANFNHGMNMFDLQRVEVLRGPQGTLYGRNTTGGSINLISMTPAVGAAPTGHIRMGAGNFGMTSVDAAAGATLVDKQLAARVALKYKEDDGYWENSAGPDMAQTKSLNGRVTINWKPTDNFSTIFKITSGSSDGRSTPPRITATAGPGITVAGRPSNTERHSGGIDRIGDNTVDMTLTSLKLSYNWEKLTLVSVSAYNDSEYHQTQDTDGTTAALAGINWAAESNAFTQDLRLVSNFEGRFSFVTGLYYDKEDTDTDILHDQLWADPAVGPTLTALGLGAAAIDPALSNHLLVLAAALPEFGQGDRRYDIERESLALYSNVTFDLNDQFRMAAGLRYTDETNTRNYINYSRLDSAGNPAGSWLPGNLLTPQFNMLGIDAPFVTDGLSQSVPLPAGLYLDGPYTLNSGDFREQSEGEFSGKFSVSYRWSGAAMIYASVARGYRSGSFNNGLVYSDQPNENGMYADPEFIDSYEAGFKGDFFAGRLRLNGALFFYDFQDQQFLNQVGISAQLVNAGGAELKGAELEMTALLTDRLIVRAGLGLLDTNYTELSLPRLGTVLDPTDSIDLSGNDLVSSPDVNFNYAIDYELAIGSRWNVLFNVNGNYLADQWFSAYNGKDGHGSIRQDGYWLHNARITLRGANERLAFSVFGQNLFDEAYDVFAINLQSGFGFNYFLEGRPAMYGAEISYRY